MRHLISVLLENEAGALSRVVGLFSARAYNIESLTVSPTQDRSISCMVIETFGSEQIIEQIIKQVNKLVEVLKVTQLPHHAQIEREIALVKIKVNSLQDKLELRQLVEVFKGEIIDCSNALFMVQITDIPKRIEQFLSQIEDHRLVDLSRSGVCAMKECLRYNASHSNRIKEKQS